MSPEEGQALIERDSRNEDVLFPYLNGEDLNSRPDQSPSRWVINFFDWPLDRSAPGHWVHADEKQRKAWLRDGRVPADYPDPVAADYPDCLAIVEEKVKPERAKLRNDGGTQSRRKKLWWRFASDARTLYSTITDLERVLVIAQTSRTQTPTFVPTKYVFDQKIIVFAFSGSADYAVMASSIHFHWIIRPGMGTMRTDAVYAPTDCFENFPLLPRNAALNELGSRHFQHRQETMASRSAGLTRLYQHFNDPDEFAPDIARLRELHVEMDKAVAAAYGWTDLSLRHGFYETRQGVRFTLSEEMQQEVLDRLLALNHERYAEEVREGLHEAGRKTAKKSGASRRKPVAGGRAAQPDLDLGFDLT